MDRIKWRSSVGVGFAVGRGKISEVTKAFTKKRFCSRKSSENQLYRSNSFKFEKFDRDEAEDLAEALAKQVSVCDEYCNPVDLVQKRRPLSIGSTPCWDSTSDKVEILDLYCDPRDSKSYCEPGVESCDKLYTAPDKEYDRPYSDSSSDSQSGDETGLLYENVGDRTPYYYSDIKDRENSMSPRSTEMSQRRLYETAFDSKISKSDDELDVDLVTNKSILVQETIDSRESTLIRSKSLRNDESTSSLCEGVSQLEIDANLRPFRAPTPPSSAPLPTKFHSGHFMASVHSAPDIPVRTKDLKLPVKSVKPRPKSFMDREGSQRTISSAGSCFNDIMEIKSRPPLPSRKPRRSKYSSTESMATSSSGGSLESIRSSTSEENRSTSSYESRRSSSLSSHSSDSATNYHHPVLHTSASRTFQQLNILSPISDKSSQEPGSETSENNKNNNSQKASPEEIISPSSEEKRKRRTPQNRNINLGLCLDREAHQGSDSGISIESRLGKCNTELTDLPFDMPKLRRRRMQAQEQVQDTSGSTTSVDLRDLPFDMPKLRRKLRSSMSSTSQGSPTKSAQQTPPFAKGRQSLSLDLQDSGRQRVSLGLSLDLTAPPLPEIVDASIPLEGQGWYHGAITRLEAEGILRIQVEGSFLVRNSESSKHDYSLSLKSTRGFMHMRIQECKETGKFILGQFSNPFNSIPDMMKFYSVNRLPIRGAEHICLSHPVIGQLL